MQNRHRRLAGSRPEVHTCEKPQVCADRPRPHPGSQNKSARASAAPIRQRSHTPGPYGCTLRARSRTLHGSGHGPAPNRFQPATDEAPLNDLLRFHRPSKPQKIPSSPSSGCTDWARMALISRPSCPNWACPEHPGVRFVFPHAPYLPVTCNGGYVMRAWYDIISLEPASRQIDEAGIVSSRAAIRAPDRTRKRSGASPAPESSSPDSRRAARSPTRPH